MPGADQVRAFQELIEQTDDEGVAALLQEAPALANVLLRPPYGGDVWPLQLALGDKEGPSGGNRLGLLRILLDAGAEIDGIADPANNEGGTALHYAAWLNAPDAVELLLSRGAATEIRSERGETAMDIAARHGNAESVEKLIVGGARYETLHLVQAGLLDRLRAALESDPSLAAKTSPAGSTLLHLALAEEARLNLDIVGLLLQIGVDPEARDARNRTALHVAVESWRPSAVSLLLSQGVAEDFYSVVATDEPAAVYWLRTVPKWALDVQPDGATPLHYACRFGRESLVRALLDLGVNPGPRCDRWWMETTPLHSAAMKGNAECCRMLIDAGADVDSLNEHEYTPLLMAVRWQHYEIVDMLLERGADRAARSAHGFAAMDWARLFKNEEMSQQLSKRGFR